MSRLYNRLVLNANCLLTILSALIRFCKRFSISWFSILLFAVRKCLISTYFGVNFVNETMNSNRKSKDFTSNDQIRKENKTKPIPLWNASAWIVNKKNNNWNIRCITPNVRMCGFAFELNVNCGQSAKDGWYNFRFGFAVAATLFGLEIFSLLNFTDIEFIIYVYS